MASDETPPRRVSLSVDILEERLANWAEDIKREQAKVYDELRRLSSRYDNSIGSIEAWRIATDLSIHNLRVDVEDLKKVAATRSELERLAALAAAIERQVSNKEVAMNAKLSLLKSQWTWLVAGIIGSSAVMGLLTQLGVLQFR